VNDSRRFPWLSGLSAAIVVALVLIVRVVAGVMSVISGLSAAS
jgi:hypothetical protein